MEPIAIVLGTRPEIIKMSPIINILQEQKIEFYIIHTNQHYSKELDEIFFSQLQLPFPDFSLEVGSGPHGEQTGKMLQRMEKIFLKNSTSFVLVHGDTNTTLSGALTAAKLNIPVGHVESGLRSNDTRMPEEINRIMTDHISELCFVPTKNQFNILRREGIGESKIFVTGNTIVDAINRNLKFMNRKIFVSLNITPKQYLLATIHRPENVDDKFRLEQILQAITEIGKYNDRVIIIPLHPRTRNRLTEFNIKIDPQIKGIKPVGYFEFLALIKHSQMVITDSGGIQEEACIMEIPCLTVRENTERPETVDVGANVLGGVSKDSIISNAKKINLNDNHFSWKNPYGDGNAASKIITIVLEFLNRQ